MLRKLILLCLLCVVDLAAQPQTPTVYLNEKVRLAEIAVGQRAILRFDLRSVGGEHLKVDLYRYDQNRGEKPVREWRIDKAAGQERLSFNDLPRAVYLLVAYACDDQGQALAYAAPLIHVEYGGWRAWEEFMPPEEVATTPPAGFQDLDVATNLRNRDVQIALDPPAVVLRPGGEVMFRAGFRGIEAERLGWTLVGKGTLKAVDEFRYLYTAPRDQVGNALVRVEIKSLAHPDLMGSALILITTADPDSLNSYGP